jgi:hypothetical protein
MLRGTWAGAALAAWVMAAGIASGQLPDPALMNGKALSAPELPAGTVTVRIFREAIGNGVAGQMVTVTSGGRSWTAKTDESGRAEFKDLPRAGQGRAEATVDGEHLVSDPFAVPASGGLRVALVAGLARAAERRKQAEAEALAAPPVRGVVSIGGNTRIIAEFQGDALRFFYQLDIVNSNRSRVDLGGPFVLDLPREAGGAEIREGSPKTASLNGTRLTVTGPFNPGTTTVNLAFQLQYSGSRYTFTQVWPVAVSDWFVGIERVNDIVVSSPQMQQTEERTTEEGSNFIVSGGPPMPAGSAFTLTLSNLPAQSRVAPTVAVAIALLILGAGAWLAFRITATTPDSQAALEKRRDAALGKLEDLERARRSGSMADERYLPRRERLLNDLEHIYGQLDASTPHG